MNIDGREFTYQTVSTGSRIGWRRGPRRRRSGSSDFATVAAFGTVSAVSHPTEPTEKDVDTVGLEVAFESREAYQAYLVDPNHLELLEIWKPRWTGATIYDVWDPGTERAAASR